MLEQWFVSQMLTVYSRLVIMAKNEMLPEPNGQTLLTPRDSLRLDRYSIISETALHLVSYPKR